MNIQKQIQKAEDLIRSGKIDIAMIMLHKLVKKFPQQFQAHGLLGVIYIFKNNYYDAEKHLNHSLSSKFNELAAKHLISLLIKQERWIEAYPWSQQLTEHKTNDLNLSINHALILRNIDKADEAIDIYSQLLLNHSNNVNIYISYGFTLNMLEKFNEAIEIYLKGLKIENYHFGLLYNLGITYLNKFDYSNALKFLLQAYDQKKQSIDLLLTIAACYAKKREFDAARDFVYEAKKIEPNNPLITFQMATLYIQQDKNNVAMDYLNQSLEMDPGHIESNFHKGIVCLKQEEYKKATLHYRYRVIRKNNKFGKFNDFELPKINKNSEILVSWEQGIGDEILYLGLIKSIRPKVKSITYITQDKIYEWVRQNFEDINVVKESESESFIKSNQYLIKLNIASLMAYIENWKDFFNTSVIWKVDHDLRKKYLKKYKQNNQKILGISWMSANKKIGDEKSIKLNDLSSIIEDQKVLSLQYGDVQNEINNINSLNNYSIIHDDELDYFNDINSLASLISVCDIVVTCSNVTAHIAGRIGIKTYLLTPKYFGNLWYWNSDSNYSKWYPSVRIYKQEIDGDWKHLLEKIKKEIIN